MVLNLYPQFHGVPEAPRPETVTGAVEFARERLGFEPDAMQSRVLESKAKRGMLLCSRQWGKSTVSAAKAVHRAWTEPEATVLVASRTERQSAALVRKARRFAAKLGFRPRGDGENKISILFPNGSRIVGVPGTEGSVRCFDVSLLLIDEAARAEDELYYALRPMLAATNGDLWLMSTPFGRRGFFFHEWVDGGARWDRVKGLATECPRISAEFLKEERQSLTENQFQQEYMCEFVDNGEFLFPRELVDGAIDEEMEELDYARVR